MVDGVLETPAELGAHWDDRASSCDGSSGECADLLEGLSWVRNNVEFVLNGEYMSEAHELGGHEMLLGLDLGNARGVRSNH